MAVAPRYRLKQTPTDVWTVRERLCLASSVLRSGDQNWVSVSRAIKPFGEPNRPPDWFSQKNCALQYSDLLEKVETPKRKRWDRGEKDTPGDLIARKLTIERIEELKKCIQEEQQKHKRIKRELELVRCGHIDDKLDEAWEQIQEEIRAKGRAELEHEKWLKEREARIAAMKAMPRVGLGPGKKKLPVRLMKVGEIRRNSSQSEQSEQDSTLDSPISEPLSVEVDDVSSPLPSVSQVEGPSVTPKSIGMAPPAISNQNQPPHTPPHPTPATSPLLTSLLKSPTPATPASPITSILSSPTPQPKEGTTATQASPRPTSTPQPFFNPTSALATAAARQLAVATAPVLSGLSMSSLFSERTESGQQIASSGTPTTHVHSATSSAPTLSKLLEMPPSTPGKLPPLPIIHTTEQLVPTVTTPAQVPVGCFPLTATSPSPPPPPPPPPPKMSVPSSTAAATTSSVVTTSSSTLPVTNTTSTVSATTPISKENSNLSPVMNTTSAVIDSLNVGIKVEIKDEPSSPLLPDCSEVDSVQSEAKDESFEPSETMDGEPVSTSDLNKKENELQPNESGQEIKEEEDFLVKNMKEETDIRQMEINLNNEEKVISLEKEIFHEKQEIKDSIIKEEKIEVFPEVETFIENKRKDISEELDEANNGESKDKEKKKMSEITKEVLPEQVIPTEIPRKESEVETINESAGEVSLHLNEENEDEEKDEIPKENVESETATPHITISLPHSSPIPSSSPQPPSPPSEIISTETPVMQVKEEVQMEEELNPPSNTLSDEKELNTGSEFESHVENEATPKLFKKLSSGRGRKKRTRVNKNLPLPEVENDLKEEIQEEEDEDDEEDLAEEDEETEIPEAERKTVESLISCASENDLPTEIKVEEITSQEDKLIDTLEMTSEEGKDEQDEDMKLDHGEEVEEVENTSVISFPIEDYSSSKQTESSEEPSQDEKSKAPSSVTDSVPNSPASTSQSDDQESLREYKVWKKSIMLVWRAAANHKYANVFLHPVTNDVAPGYHSIVFRPMDLSAIKKNIETGVIKTTLEFQRDMMLMFQNAIMYNSSDHDVFHMAIEMQKEVMEHIQDFLATQLMVQTAETKVLRGREPREKKSDSGEKQDEDGKRKRTSSDGDAKSKKRRIRVDE